MNLQPDNKPELLIPVGNIESFYAALEGGADAIYMGLKDFNARNRAMNFSAWQVAAMVKLARKQNVKCYITLNTVIRNFELGTLTDILYQLQQIQPAGVIVQDIGVLYLIKKFFPGLTVHASTQMAIHNSEGVEYAAQKGIKRVVMARELTLPELKQITSKSRTEIELFIHGALCYSFSGMCLFSSYLGGASANRGLCTQPCRRLYIQNDEKRKTEKYFFSLKDNQLIDQLDEIKKMGITSLKVEGRLKPGEYVYRVARAYRLAIDSPEKTEEARAMLQNDLAREKTSYFVGKDVADAITQAATTGLFLGNVVKSEEGRVSFTSRHELSAGCRLRFRNPHNDKQIDLKADELTFDGNIYSLPANPQEIKKSYEVYLTGGKQKFNQNINTDDIHIKEHLQPDRSRQILNSLRIKNRQNNLRVFIRIDNPGWIKHIDFNRVHGIILKLSNSEWNNVQPLIKTVGPFKHKIFIELPKFIAEGKTNHYRSLANRLFRQGFTAFFINHLSQKLLLPKEAEVSTTENVYAFNDAAVRFLKEESIRYYITPFENDISNLARGADRNGIVPAYFYPELFYSRMPVELEKHKLFADKKGEKYKKFIRDGITIVIPEKPVSVTQYRNKLERFGFSSFLIDLSYHEPSDETISRITGAFFNSEAIKPSTLFNFKRELK